ncbi:MAG: hypothetical protein AAGF85_13745 [Bacteroidota bacterium]
MKIINMLARILLVIAVPIGLPHLVVHLSEQAKVHTAACHSEENTTNKNGLEIDSVSGLIYDKKVEFRLINR